jgi:Flp pilus assembly protein TadB
VIDRRGLIFAACYGAIVTTVAYLLARGSILWFIAIMVLLGLAVRVWAVWYRRRHGLPMRRVRLPRKPK